MTLDTHKLQQEANGMLAPSVYQAIYETAYSAPDGDILEIGTAHGAATIALAQGMKDAGKNGRILTIDKITGGSRERYGDVATNEAIIRDNFRQFGVDSMIRFYIGESQQCAKDLPDDMHISVLMLDADGAIDRDLRLFMDYCHYDTRVIMDDCHDSIKLKHAKRTLYIDQKHRLTYLLVTYLDDNGGLCRDDMDGETWFGRIRDKHMLAEILKSEAIYEIYRQLIFAQQYITMATHPRSRNIIDRISQATQKYPGLHRHLKNVYEKTLKKGA